MNAEKGILCRVTELLVFWEIEVASSHTTTQQGVARVIPIFNFIFISNSVTGSRNIHGAWGFLRLLVARINQ